MDRVTSHKSWRIMLNSMPDTLEWPLQAARHRLEHLNEISARLCIKQILDRQKTAQETRHPRVVPAKYSTHRGTHPSGSPFDMAHRIENREEEMAFLAEIIAGTTQDIDALELANPPGSEIKRSGHLGQKTKARPPRPESDLLVPPQRLPKRTREGDSDPLAILHSPPALAGIRRVLPKDFNYNREHPKPKPPPVGKAAYKSAPTPKPWKAATRTVRLWKDDFHQTDEVTSIPVTATAAAPPTTRTTPSATAPVPTDSSSSYSYTYSSYSSDTESDKSLIQPHQALDNPPPTGEGTSPTLPPSSPCTPTASLDADIPFPDSLTTTAKAESEIDWEEDNPAQPHIALPTTSHDPTTPPP